MPSSIAQLTPLHPPDPLRLDELAMLYIAMTRMLEDRDAFATARLIELEGLRDKIRAHAIQLAGRPIGSLQLEDWFRTGRPK
jgi:hypothetical protein